MDKTKISFPSRQRNHDSSDTQHKKMRISNFVEIFSLSLTEMIDTLRVTYLALHLEEKKQSKRSNDAICNICVGLNKQAPHRCQHTQSPCARACVCVCVCVCAHVRACRIQSTLNILVQNCSPTKGPSETAFIETSHSKPYSNDLSNT